MEQKEAYQKKLDAQLNEWRAEIDKLKAKAEKASAERQIEYNRQVDELEAKQKAARMKLEEIQKSGGQAWEDLKSSLDSAMDELKAGIQSAASKFK